MNFGFKIEIQSSIYKLPGRILTYDQLIDQIEQNFKERIPRKYKISYSSSFSSITTTTSQEDNTDQIRVACNQDFKNLLACALDRNMKNIKLKITEYTEDEPFLKDLDESLFNWCDLIDRIDIDNPQLNHQQSSSITSFDKNDDDNNNDDVELFKNCNNNKNKNSINNMIPSFKTQNELEEKLSQLEIVFSKDNHSNESNKQSSKQSEKQQQFQQFQKQQQQQQLQLQNQIILQSQQNNNNQNNNKNNNNSKNQDKINNNNENNNFEEEQEEKVQIKQIREECLINLDESAIIFIRSENYSPMPQCFDYEYIQSQQQQEKQKDNIIDYKSEYCQINNINNFNNNNKNDFCHQDYQDYLHSQQCIQDEENEENQKKKNQFMMKNSDNNKQIQLFYRQEKNQNDEQLKQTKNTFSSSMNDQILNSQQSLPMDNIQQGGFIQCFNQIQSNISPLHHNLIHQIPSPSHPPLSPYLSQQLPPLISNLQHLIQFKSENDALLSSTLFSMNSEITHHRKIDQGQQQQQQSCVRLTNNFIPSQQQLQQSASLNQSPMNLKGKINQIPSSSCLQNFSSKLREEDEKNNNHFITLTSICPTNNNANASTNIYINNNNNNNNKYNNISINNMNNINNNTTINTMILTNNTTAGLNMNTEQQNLSHVNNRRKSKTTIQHLPMPSCKLTTSICVDNGNQSTIDHSQISFLNGSNQTNTTLPRNFILGKGSNLQQQQDKSFNQQLTSSTNDAQNNNNNNTINKLLPISHNNSSTNNRFSLQQNQISSMYSSQSKQSNITCQINSNMNNVNQEDTNNNNNNYNIQGILNGFQNIIKACSNNINNNNNTNITTTTSQDTYIRENKCRRLSYKIPCQQVCAYRAKIINSPQKQFCMNVGDELIWPLCFQNNGELEWPQKSMLRCLEGFNDGQFYPIDCAGPSQIASIELKFVVPIINYNSISKNSFRLCYFQDNDELKYFGPKVTFELLLIQQTQTSQIFNSQNIEIENINTQYIQQQQQFLSPSSTISQNQQIYHPYSIQNNQISQQQLAQPNTQLSQVETYYQMEDNYNITTPITSSNSLNPQITYHHLKSSSPNNKNKNQNNNEMSSSSPIYPYQQNNQSLYNYNQNSGNKEQFSELYSINNNQNFNLLDQNTNQQIEISNFELLTNVNVKNEQQVTINQMPFINLDQIYTQQQLSQQQQQHQQQKQQQQEQQQQQQQNVNVPVQFFRRSINTN